MLLASTGMGSEVSSTKKYVSRCFGCALFQKKNQVHVTIDEKHGRCSTFKRSGMDISRSGASGNLCNHEVTVHVGLCSNYGFCRECWSNVWMVFDSEQDCLVVGSKEQNFYEMMCAQVSLIRNSTVACTNVMKYGRDCFRNQRIT